MEKERMSKGAVRYFQGSARDFTPIMVSANFAALVGPVSLGKCEEPVEEFTAPVQHAA